MTNDAGINFLMGVAGAGIVGYLALLVSSHGRRKMNMTGQKDNMFNTMQDAAWFMNDLFTALFKKDTKISQTR